MAYNLNSNCQRTTVHRWETLVNVALVAYCYFWLGILCTYVCLHASWLSSRLLYRLIEYDSWHCWRRSLCLHRWLGGRSAGWVVERMVGLLAWSAWDFLFLLLDKMRIYASFYENKSALILNLLFKLCCNNCRPTGCPYTCGAHNNRDVFCS